MASNAGVIYVDEIQTWHSGKWCHMWTDGTDAELDAFALGIGLKKEWAQDKRGATGRFYHYDLRPSKRTLALKHGAVSKSLREWIREKMREQKAEISDD